MNNYLSEAFKKLDILDEDVFELDKDGLTALKDFEDSDEDDMITVVDPDAESEEDLEDSYIGKVILDCSVCHTDIYKDKEDITIDDESGLANIGEECPYCYSSDGFKVIGEVKPFVEVEVDTDDDVDVEADGEEVEEEDEEEEKNESLKRKKRMVEAVSSRRNRKSLTEGWRGTDLEIVSHGSWGDPDLVYHDDEDGEDYVFNYWDIENGLWDMFLDETGHKDSESDDQEVEAEFDKYVQDNYGWYLSDAITGGYFDEGSTDWHDRYKRESLRNRKPRKMKESIEDKLSGRDLEKFKDKLRTIISHANMMLKDTEKQDLTYQNVEDYMVVADGFINSLNKIVSNNSSIKESIEDITIDTGEQEITVSAKDKEEAESDGEMIAPLSDEAKSDIEAGSDDTVDVDVDEFSEEDFDELGESYLKKVYENVDGYKTTSAKSKGNKLYVEGLIKFNSGKQKKTSFVFESRTITKTGKAKLIGENLQISRGHKSFKLTGTINNGKFISESLNYNYRVKNGNSSQRVYGTAKKSK